jgi:hypothetical protein
MEIIEVRNIKEFEEKVTTEILVNSFNVYLGYPQKIK